MRTVCNFLGQRQTAYKKISELPCRIDIPFNSPAKVGGIIEVSEPNDDKIVEVKTRYMTVVAAEGSFEDLLWWNLALQNVGGEEVRR